MKKLSIILGGAFLMFSIGSANLNAHNHNPDNKDKITKTETKESQAKMTPAQAVLVLKEGNERFVKGEALNYDFGAQVDKTSTGQYPHSIILSCVDSRIPTEIVFDQGIGDVFNARIAGNFVNYDILGSMEFATKVAGSKLIVVMGHTACGAVKGACDGAELGNLTQMLDKIEPAIEAVETAPGVERSSKNIEFVNDVATMNVMLTVDDIRSMSPVLREMHDNGEIDIVGAMYDINTGKVTFVEM